MPAQTTMWDVVLMKQIGRARRSKNPKGISSISPALDDGVGLRWVDESN